MAKNIVVNGAVLSGKLKHLSMAIEDCLRDLETSKEVLENSLDSDLLRKSRCALCMEPLIGTHGGVTCATLEIHNPYGSNFHGDCMNLLYLRERMIVADNLARDAFFKKKAKTLADRYARQFKLKYIRFCLLRGLPFANQYLHNSAVGYDKDWRKDVREVIAGLGHFPKKEEITRLYSEKNDNEPI